MMIDFFGFVFSLFVLAFVAIRFRFIAWPMMVAFALRTLFALINHFDIWAVPGGRADAIGFARRAELWSHLSWPDLFMEFDLSGSRVFSWLGAVLYKVFGVSPLLFTSVNVLLGSLIIPVTYWLALRLFDHQVARRAAWFAALMPFAVFFSSVLLREVVSILPFMLGLVAVTYWIERARLLYAVLALLCFSVSTVFHGAWAISMLAFAVVVLREQGTALLRSLMNRRIRLRLLLSGVVVVAAIGGAVLVAIGSALNLGTVGAIDQLVAGGGIETLEETAREETRGGSGYPAFVANIDPVNKPWGIPIRMAYFLFSPFPWDISSPRHLQGLIASFVFIAIVLSLWNGRHRLYGNRQAQAVLIITGVMIFVFAFGTGNIGTSIRHRTKFFFALLALACGPVFKRRIVWRRKSRALLRQAAWARRDTTD